MCFLEGSIRGRSGGDPGGIRGPGAGGGRPGGPTGYRERLSGRAYRERLSGLKLSIKRPSHKSSPHQGCGDGN